ncbi:MAG: hypothetical protein ACOC9D_04915, partial [Thermodesulfobacteriota bacterium]
AKREPCDRFAFLNGVSYELGLNTKSMNIESIAKTIPQQPATRGIMKKYKKNRYLRLRFFCKEQARNKT